MGRRWGLTAVLSVLGLAAACGGSSKSDIVGAGQDTPDGSVGGNVGDGGSSAGDGGTAGPGEGGSANPDGGKDGSAPCMGIGCNVSACSGKKPTSLVGQVFDPAGKNALYDVIAYVPTDPNAALPPFAKSDRCGALPVKPVTAALTDETGQFVLQGVPTMKNLPVVIQIGKWRKKITFDVTNDCGENKITDKITLPKNGTEGDMPHIAVSTGGCDALECLLLGMGIDQSEFVQGADPTGHIHLYKGAGGTTGVDAQTMLWDTTAHLAQHDIVALSCECDEHNENKPSDKLSLHDYVEAGGRVLATHYHYTWFSNGPADFKGVAQWTPSAGGGGMSYVADQSFPKGHAFAQWLKNVGATSTVGVVPLVPANVASDLKGVFPPTQAWIVDDMKNVKLFTFNAPIAAAPQNQIGRVLYTDLHVSGLGGETFPTMCSPAPGNDLSAQQKALEFMMLDLASCVRSDSAQPLPPP